jgi:organic hydroperoxide reductase OsmC/OhrA
MIRYPLEFNYTASASKDPAWTTQAPEGRAASCAVPPEFEGPGGGFSPEDFFGLALLNCFMGTFKVIAEKSRVEFESLTASGTLTVDRDSEGKPWMSAFEIRACIVAHSVKTRVTFALEMA